MLLSSQALVSDKDFGPDGESPIAFRFFIITLNEVCVS